MSNKKHVVSTSTQQAIVKQASNAIQQKKIFVFIDAENVRSTMEQYGYKDLDYVKVYNWLTKSLGVSRIYIYVGIDNGDVNKENRFIALEKLGYNVFKKKVMIYVQDPILHQATCKKCGNTEIIKIPKNKKSKANCDADMTLDIVNCGVRKKYNEIIVFSGDGDFARVYEYVSQKLNKKVNVYSPLSPYPVDRRTSLKIKELGQKGIITLLDLSSLLQHYGEK